MQRILGYVKNSKADTMTLLGWAMFLLVLDRLWGFIFVNTIYASVAMVYLLFITILVLFLTLTLKHHFGNAHSMSIAWIPYLLYTIGGYFFNFKLQHVTYWYACLMMLQLAPLAFFLKQVPFRFLFWSGLFCVLGVLIQLFLPSFYNSHIAGIFVTDYIELWVEERGFNGFTYQLGMTASIIIYGEVVLLYMKDKIFGRLVRRDWIYFLLVVLFIICEFLTGKRLMAALALVMPFMVYFLSERSKNKFLVILITIIIAAIGYWLFTTNVAEYTDNVILRRFADTYIDVSSGGDVSSGRTYLYMLALKAFEDHPYLGIGVGQFKAYTGMNTDVHNTYLQVLCEQGVIGFAVFIIPIIFCFMHTCLLFSKVPKTPYFKYLQMSLAIQLVYIVYCLSGNVNIGSGFVLYFMGIAMVINVETQCKKLIR